VNPPRDRLHVVVVSPPWYPVPPEGYGGVEMVVHLLVRELRGMGHHVTLVGAEGSAHDAVPQAPAAWRADLGTAPGPYREATYAARVADLLAGAGDVDVVHDHVGTATLIAAALSSSAPVVHTCHGPLDEPQRTFYASLRTRVGMVAISDSQRQHAPELPWIGTVPNAVDVDDLPSPQPNPADPGYLLCLARVTPDKGQHLAVDVARRAGLPLTLAGKVDNPPESQRYWREQVAPAVDGERVRHVENVAGREKLELLRGATALLAPIQWNEPFGLSAVEAMVCGTPAISMRRGAAVELIEDGVTGFLVDDVEGMADAVRRCGEIDRVRCAAVARERFRPQAMARGYVEVYRRALRR